MGVRKIIIKVKKKSGCKKSGGKTKKTGDKKNGEKKGGTNPIKKKE